MTNKQTDPQTIGVDEIIRREKRDVRSNGVIQRDESRRDAPSEIFNYRLPRRR